MWYKFQKLCDIFFTTIAVPTSLFVAATFWSIYAYDRNLVYPEVFDLFVPGSTNHFWHTTVVLWLCLKVSYVFIAILILKWLLVSTLRSMLLTCAGLYRYLSIVVIGFIQFFTCCLYTIRFCSVLGVSSLVYHCILSDKLLLGFAGERQSTYRLAIYHWPEVGIIMK